MPFENVKVPAPGGGTGVEVLSPRGSTESGALSWQASLFALLLCCLWGGLAPAIKVGLRGMPPVGMAGWRFLLALACLLAWCRWRRIPLNWALGLRLGMIGLSFLFVLQIALLNVGARLTSSSHMIVLLNSAPLFVVIIAHFLVPDDRFTWRKVTGLLLSFGGICITFRDAVSGVSSSWVGDSLVLISGFLLAVLQIYSKHLVRRLTPYEVIVGQMVYGVPLFFVASALLDPPVAYQLTGGVWLSLIYQGVVVGAFCFSGWIRLLSRYSASKVSAFLFTAPLFGVGLSRIVLGDEISRSFLAGAGLVAVGIYWAVAPSYSGRSSAVATTSMTGLSS
ncbi:MAG: DMT family transporter [Acidobacteriota bacterium]